MVAAFAAAGVSLPRVTYTQAVAGSPVDPANIAPGDLVFPMADLSHVQMALGGGQMVEAPYTGANVRTGPLYGTARVRRVADPGVGPSGQGASAETVGLSNPLSTADKAWSAIQALGKFVAWLTNPHNWVRVASVLGGLAVLAISIDHLAGLGIMGKLAPLAAVAAWARRKPPQRARDRPMTNTSTKINLIDIGVAVIGVAIITAIFGNPRSADAIKSLGDAMAGAIRAILNGGGSAPSAAGAAGPAGPAGPAGAAGR
jgi:hypothetical protein